MKEEQGARGAEFEPLVHIRSGPEAPEDAHAAIRYDAARSFPTAPTKVV